MAEPRVIDLTNEPQTGTDLNLTVPPIDDAVSLEQPLLSQEQFDDVTIQTEDGEELSGIEARDYMAESQQLGFPVYEALDLTKLPDAGALKSQLTAEGLELTKGGGRISTQVPVISKQAGEMYNQGLNSLNQQNQMRVRQYQQRATDMYNEQQEVDRLTATAQQRARAAGVEVREGQSGFTLPDPRGGAMLDEVFPPAPTQVELPEFLPPPPLPKAEPLRVSVTTPQKRRGGGGGGTPKVGPMPRTVVKMAGGSITFEVKAQKGLRALTPLQDQIAGIDEIFNLANADTIQKGAVTPISKGNIVTGALLGRSRLGRAEKEFQKKSYKAPGDTVSTTLYQAAQKGLLRKAVSYGNIIKETTVDEKGNNVTYAYLGNPNATTKEEHWYRARADKGAKGKSGKMIISSIIANPGAFYSERTQFLPAEGENGTARIVVIREPNTAAIEAASRSMGQTVDDIIQNSGKRGTINNIVIRKLGGDTVEPQERTDTINTYLNGVGAVFVTSKIRAVDDATRSAALKGGTVIDAKTGLPVNLKLDDIETGSNEEELINSNRLTKPGKRQLFGPNPFGGNLEDNDKELQEIWNTIIGL